MTTLAPIAIWHAPPKLFVCDNCDAQFLIGMKEQPRMYRSAYPTEEFLCPVCDAGNVNETDPLK